MKKDMDNSSKNVTGTENFLMIWVNRMGNYNWEGEWTRVIIFLQEFKREIWNNAVFTDCSSEQELMLAQGR